MSTYTLYEYSTVTTNGVPVEPPSTRTAGMAFDAAARLDASTVYAAVVPDANAHLRVSHDGGAATTGDSLLTAGEPRGFPVSEGARPYVYLIAAA